MKRYEKESLLKSFFIFFSLQIGLLSIIFFQDYSQKIYTLNDNIKTKMKICSFDLKCKKLKIDFVLRSDDMEIEKLYIKNDVFSFFLIPNDDNFYMKIIFPNNSYSELLTEIKFELLKKFIFYTFLIAIFSLLFSLYSLKPLKDAIKLNEEFVKDILHDFNTPISSMIINFKILKKMIGENINISRVENNIETILILQKNLQTFLKQK